LTLETFVSGLIRVAMMASLSSTKSKNKKQSQSKCSTNSKDAGTIQSSATLLTPPLNQQSKASRLDPLPRTPGGRGGWRDDPPDALWEVAVVQWSTGLPAAGTTTRPKADELGKMH